MSTSRLLVLAIALSGCSPTRGVPVLLWHAVGEGSPADDYDLSSEEFDRQLAALEQWGAKTVTLDQVFDARAGGAPLPERAVVLTFDDGRACLHRAAMPLLAKRAMVAEVFVVSDWIGEDEDHRHVVRDEQGEHPYLLWSELAQMVRSRAFRVQSHSVSHPRHTDLSREQMRAQLVDSRRAITEHLGVPVNFYAYPFGAFDTPYRDEAERAGYRGALAVGKGPGTRFGLLRTSLRRGSEGALREILSEAFGAPVRGPVSDPRAK